MDPRGVREITAILRRAGVKSKCMEETVWAIRVAAAQSNVRQDCVIARLEREAMPKAIREQKAWLRSQAGKSKRKV